VLCSTCRALFGRRSQKIDADQLQLQLSENERSIGARTVVCAIVDDFGRISIRNAGTETEYIARPLVGHRELHVDRRIGRSR
jgi:hypothetical protein